MNKYLIFYFIMISLLAGKAANTIYQGSMIINHGSKIAQLQKEKQRLNNRQLELTNQIAENYSINSILSSEEMAEYTTIVNPIVIKGSTKVASMQ